MKTVHRFPLQLSDEQTLMLPEGAEVLHAGRAPNGEISLWARVETEAPPKARRFLLRGTGHPLPDGVPLVHRATIIDGFFVGHLFEESFR